MRDQKPTLLLIAVLAILGLALGGDKRSATTTNTAPAAKSEHRSEDLKPERSQRASADLNSLKPLKGFFQVDDPNPVSSPLPEGLARADVGFLVATVPDPIDSRFGYSFDSAVDAVQLAIESQDFSLDRFWLPWAPSGQQQGKLEDLLPGGNERDAENGAPLALHEREPGILLFRGKPGQNSGRERLMIVFLVGESSLSGIHKVAFTRCLGVIRKYDELAHRRPITPRPPVRIVGPYFSGSAESMALALESWGGPDPKPSKPEVRIITGSATLIDPETWKRRADRVEVRFNATVVPDYYVIRGIFDYLARVNGGTPDKVAILTESDTAYGKEIAALVERYKNLDVLLMKFPYHISQVRTAYIQDRDAPQRSIPSLFRSGSRLRIPFDETGSPSDTVPALSPAMTAATDEFLLSKILLTIYREDYKYVGIAASDTRDTIFLTDLVRTFCPDVQMFTNLSNLLLAHPDYSTRFRGMLVASTYPMFSPSQRWTFPFNGGRQRRLFHSQSDQGIFNAVLAQIAETQGPSPEAALSMLDYGVPFEQEASPGRRSSSAGAERRPPLWISVIGQRGLWPLEYQVPDPARDRGKIDEPHRVYVNYVLASPARKPAKATRSLPQYTWAWACSFVSFSLLCLWLVLVSLILLRQDSSKPPSRRGVIEPVNLSATFSRVLRPLAPIRKRSEGRWRRTYHLAYCLLLTLSVGGCYLWFAHPCLLIGPGDILPSASGINGGGSSWRSLDAVIALSAVLLTILTVSCLCSLALVQLFCLFDASGRLRRLGIKSYLALLALAACVPATCLLITWFSQALRTINTTGRHVSQHASNMMFFERAITLTNGVSPLTPTLFLAMVFVSYFFCQLRRVDLLDRIHSPGLIDIRPSKAERMNPLAHIRLRIWNRVRKIDKFLLRPFPWPLSQPYILLPLVLLGMTYARLWKKYVPTFDRNWYSVVMLWAFILLSLAIVLAFIRLWLLWRHIEKLFRDFTLLPMLRAYDRIPRLFSRMYGRYLDELEPRLSHLSIAVQQWAQVAQNLDAARDGLLTLLSTARLPKNDPEAQLDRLASGIKPKPAAQGLAAARDIHALFEQDLSASGAYARLQTSKTRLRLAKAATACFKLLVNVWPATTVEAGYGDPLPKADGKTPAGETGTVPASGVIDTDTSRWIRLAEELVAVELVTCVHRYTVHLRNLAAFLTVGPLLMLLTVTTYPFEPSRYLLVLMGTIVVVVVTGMIFVYIKIDRNEFLSRVSRTPPDQVTFDRTFIASILTNMLPLFGILIAGFPDASDLLNTWLEPLSRFFR